ncbi:uncharacterized protein [Chironomus tepperi]|uniref:uncharacterized protein n=1 Tax=Chironomus tepperi TaxID=113505 RepID=UPI00391FBC4C
MDYSSENPHKISLYPLAGEYIATIDYQPPNRSITCQSIETVVILDRSGSMGQSVFRIGTKILPLFFQKLNYDINDKIHLITFDNVAEYQYLEINELPNLVNFQARGGTYMSVGIQTFHEIMRQLTEKGTKFLRILTISDGEVFDAVQTITEAEKVADFLHKYEMSISSKAVRWFTSDCDPDTTALCCLMQLNNIQDSKMLDIRYDVSFEEASSAWAALFEGDGMFNGTHLSCESPVFLKYPWDSNALDSLLLVPGKNTFWLKDIPENLMIDNRPVDIEINDSISYHYLQNLLTEKVDCIISRMKILKIVESATASDTIQKILNYFKRIENEVPDPDLDVPADAKNLKNRMKLIKIRLCSQKISTVLSEIANDNMVHKLNSAQKAAYLRQTMVTKGSKSLAKRSAKCTGELDFDEIARKEALKIAENFHEIADIDDSGHELSFYSQATTIEGIKTLIEFTKDEAFQNASVLEILELLNIVGVACRGPVGDYPDPSTWIIDKIYPSCFVSFADILSVLNQSEYNKLFVPAYDEEITNSIPIFDDPRIGKFLKRYARSLLDFTFSIGMRQMIAEVPKTTDYTMIAGARCMIDLISTDKTTKTYETFKNMVTAVENFAGKFDVDELLVPQKCGNYGYFLDNSGISEMIVPFIRVIRQNKPEIVNLIPAMLRSIYNYEIWLKIRRNYKGMDYAKEIITDMMIKLLQIDIEKYKINVEEPPKELVFNDTFEINSIYVKELTENLSHLNITASIPVYLNAVINGTFEDVKTMPAVDSNLFLNALDINYSYETYMFLNVFQALRYTTKQERCDTEIKTMKIIDLKNYKEALEDVKLYVRNFFQKQYEFDMARKSQMEAIRFGNSKYSNINIERYQSQLQREPAYAKMAVQKIIEATNYNDMIEAWKNGIELNGKGFKIVDPGNFGYRLLKLALGNLDLKIPMRSEIIEVIMFGVDRQDQEVWNRGQRYSMRSKGCRYFRIAFLYNSSYEDWDKLMMKYWKA